MHTYHRQKIFKPVLFEVLYVNLWNENRGFKMNMEEIVIWLTF